MTGVAPPTSTATPPTSTPAAGVPPTAPQPTQTATPAPETPPPSTPPAPPAFTLQLPQGTSLDNVVLDAYTRAAQANGLSREQAQKVLESIVPVADTRQTEVLAERVKAVHDGWAQQAQADPDIGGEKFAATQAAVAKALDKVGTPALRELLTTTGIGNHPEVLRMLARIGREVSVDTVVVGQANPGAAPSAADVLFPGLKK